MKKSQSNPTVEEVLQEWKRMQADVTDLRQRLQKAEQEIVQVASEGAKNAAGE